MRLEQRINFHRVRGLFHLGDRVCLTLAGEARILSGRRGSNRATGGIVCGYSRDGRCVRVKRDGSVTIEAYHWTFWEVV